MSTATNVLKMPGKQQEPEDEILTLEETAAYLKVTKRMLYDNVQRQAIPHLRCGKFIRFSRKTLMEWMKEQAES